MPTPELDRFARRCRRLARIAMGLAGLTLLAPLLIWALYDLIDPDYIRHTLGLPATVSLDLPIGWRILGGVGEVLFALPTAAAWYCLGRFLFAVASAPVFPRDAVRWLWRLSKLLLAMIAAHILGHTARIALITAADPNHPGVLNISVNVTDVTLIFFASLVALFAWIFGTAADLEAEQRLTV